MRSRLLIVVLGWLALSLTRMDGTPYPVLPQNPHLQDIPLSLINILMGYAGPMPEDGDGARLVQPHEVCASLGKSGQGLRIAVLKQPDAPWSG